MLFGALAAAAGLLLTGRLTSHAFQRTTAALALAASLAGPLAYSISTASMTHSGAIVSAGPSTGFGGFGAGGRGGFGQNGAGQNTAQNARQQTSQGTQTGFGGNRQGGGMGGLLGATTPSAELVTALKTGASGYTWAAAVVGSNNAAGYQLATELPVMAVGGFNGTDPSPTLVQFQQLVAQGKIHYFIAGGTMQADSGSAAPAQIAAWVAANFQAQTIGGTTVYILAG